MKRLERWVPSLLTGLLVALVMMVLARLVMRKDLSTMERLIGYASDVAKGDEQGQIPPSVGSRDVRELQAALATMVMALHQRIAIESRSVASVVGFPFVTRTAESPRPMPQTVRLPYISFKVAKRLAVTVQSRVAGLVTMGPTLIERVDARIWL